MQAENPWLHVPAEDYENHMSAENVGQLQALNAITKSKLEYLRPISLAILGCATGNGFEHVNTKITKVVCGIDINEQYLDIAQERYGDKIKGLQLIKANLNTDDIQTTDIDLVIAGLIFEYLDISTALAKTRNILSCDGNLIVILQNTINSDIVSATDYSTLNSLSTIFKEVSEFDFGAVAAKHGLMKINRETYSLNEQKELIVLTFRKGML